MQSPAVTLNVQTKRLSTQSIDYYHINPEPLLNHYVTTCQQRFIL